MVVLHSNGHVEVATKVHGVGVVIDAFYPLCGNAVQTEIFSGHYEVRVRPDCFTKRTVFEKFGP